MHCQEQIQKLMVSVQLDNDDNNYHYQVEEQDNNNVISTAKIQHIDISHNYYVKCQCVEFLQCLLQGTGNSTRKSQLFLLICELSIKLRWGKTT